MLRADAPGLAAAGPHAAAAVMSEVVREGDLFGMAPGDFAMLANAARLQTGGAGGGSKHTQPYLLKIILDRLPAPEQGASPPAHPPPTRPPSPTHPHRHTHARSASLMEVMQVCPCFCTVRHLPFNHTEVCSTQLRGS